MLILLLVSIRLLCISSVFPFPGSISYKTCLRYVRVVSVFHLPDSFVAASGDINVNSHSNHAWNYKRIHKKTRCRAGNTPFPYPRRRSGTPTPQGLSVLLVSLAPSIYTQTLPPTTTANNNNNNRMKHSHTLTCNQITTSRKRPLKKAMITRHHHTMMKSSASPAPPPTQQTP